MQRQRITTAGNSAVLPLSRAVLDELGVEIGDEVDVAVVNGALVLRPLDESSREQALEAVITDVLERRSSAYQKLAE